MPYRNYFHQTLYSSGTVVATGDTGIIAVPSFGMPNVAIFPLCFFAVGADMTTDETNDITIEWHTNAAGTGGAIGTTTFTQLTAGVPSNKEGWPGDVTLFNAAKEMVPLPPYHKITHTLAGTTKSMSYILYVSYMVHV